MPTSTAILIELLERSKHRFTRADRAAKRHVVLNLAERPIGSATLLLRLHEALCFLRAYPDDARLLGAVDHALAGFGKRVAALRAAEARRLDETGVAGTTVYCPLSYPAARWLAGWAPESVEIDGDGADSEDAIAAILPVVVGVLAEEAWVEVGVCYRAWLAAAKGADPRSDLAWLLGRLEGGPHGGELGRALYDRVQPRLRWALGEGPGSRTLARVPVGRVFFQASGLARRGGPLSRRLPGPRVLVTTASRGEATGLLDAARAAVTVRYREVHAFNFADPGDVVRAHAGRGVEIAWFGVAPAHRLPLRAHYGYLLLRNGVPVGYGDASLLFDWCEIAFNVFETFRQGESAFVFARLLGFLCRWLGARTFHLSPYQLGRGNDEALASGAFWFYSKLGFRPTRPDLARLAEAERRRIRRDPVYRSPRETLARLAEDRMALAVGRGLEVAVAGFDAGRVGRRAAAGSPVTPVADIAAALGAGRWRAWPRPERVAFERLAPIVAAIPDVARWPVGDRRALVAIIRAKGGPCERDYIRRLQSHSRLRASLLRLGAPESQARHEPRLGGGPGGEEW